MDEGLWQASQKLQAYIEQNNYKGFDPYDALKSPLFNLPFFRSNKMVRFASQQIVKRSPLNLRTVLFVPKGRNPVTLGLCVQAYADLLKLDPENKSLIEKIKFLVDELEKLISKGFHGACWGYDFDWEARYAKIDAHQPTVVATGIISNALFRVYQVTANKRAGDLVVSAASFVQQDLQKSVDRENNLCFSYSPFDKQQVFNASMKGARVLSQAYSLTQNEKLKEDAGNTVKFVVNHQQENGSWVYSLSKSGNWIDNYHTGYVLDCLHEYSTLTNDNSFLVNLKKGFEFYRSAFFREDFAPKFYDQKLFPIDSTAAGQSLLTLCRFGEVEMAKKVARWYINNMQDKKGYFYFRKYKLRTDKTSYMRWSNAWMFAGLAYLLCQSNSK